MATDKELLRGAQATLLRAISDLYPETRVSQTSLFNILGLVWGENKFGQGADWQGSNNWGALRCYRQDYGCIEHGERNAQGTPIVVRFQRFPSQPEGAKGFLRTLLKTQAERDALQSGDPHELARALYAAGYFTGTTGSAEDRIQSYAMLIRRGASQVRAILGSTAVEVIAPSVNTRVTEAAILGTLVLGTGIWYLYNRPRR